MLKDNDFWNYSEEQEKEDGMYWEFVNSSTEDIKSAKIYYPDIGKIILKIKDTNLKEKMCDRLYDLLMELGVLSSGGEPLLSKGIYTNEQVVALIKHDISEIGIPKINENMNINTILDYIKFAFLLNDRELIYGEISKIFKAFNQDENIPKLEEKYARSIYCILRRDPELAERFIKEYSSKISKEFLKFLEIQKDPEYIQKKAELFRERKISIGIDQKISFGLEIEADNNNDIQFYASDQKGYEEYRSTSEATVPMGEEIVSPPLHDLPEDVSKLCALLETMNEAGFYYDEEQENAAGQINIGLDYLNSTKAVINFFEIFGNCEELLFHISNKEGQLTRQSVYVNSRFKAISEIIGKRIIDEDITRYELLELLYVPFNNGYNEKKYIEKLQYKKNTVGIRDLNIKDRARLEIRIPNGSTEYQVWIDNIRLYGKIVEISRKLAEIQSKDEITDEEEKLLGMKEDLKDPRNTLEDKLFILMDLLFEDDEIKQIYVNRFYTLQRRIKETGTDKYKPSIYGKYEPEFDMIDFENLYKSTRKRGVITFDPETGAYNENGKEEILESK